MAQRELKKIASVLVVVGAVILLVVGLARAFGSAIMLPFTPRYLPVMAFGRGVEDVVGGL